MRGGVCGWLSREPADREGYLNLRSWSWFSFCSAGDVDVDVGLDVGSEGNIDSCRYWYCYWCYQKNNEEPM